MPNYDPSLTLDEMENCVRLAAAAKLEDNEQGLLDAIRTFNIYCDVVGSISLNEVEATRFDGIFDSMQNVSRLPIPKNSELHVL